MTEALLKTSKHTITAITRENKLPKGVLAKKVDHSKPETLIEALRNQETLVTTLSVFTLQETAGQIVNAAGEAGVPWVLPNEWSPGTANEALVKDAMVFQPKGEPPLHLKGYFTYKRLLTIDYRTCSHHP